LHPEWWCIGNARILGILEWSVPPSPTAFTKVSAVRGYGGQREWWNNGRINEQTII
jgi:hypothetical protein